MSTPEIDIEDLPASIRDWVGLIGLDAVWKLVKRWAGTPLYVPTPERLDTGHELSRLLGYDLALVLCEHVQHGDYVLIPRCTEALRELRRKRMLDDLKYHSVDIVARRHGVHRRTVFRVIERAGGMGDGQRGLFDD